jgi:organic radical activating enzyme
MRGARGIAHRLSALMMGLVRHAPDGPCLYVTTAPQRWARPIAVLTTAAQLDPVLARLPGITALPASAVQAWQEGDILLLEPDGRVQYLWACGAHSNVLFFTHACNCRCRMCPQPREYDAPHQAWITQRLLNLLTPAMVTQIGITGGEPTLHSEALCLVLAQCRRRFPQAPITLLTNGRAFANLAFARRIAAIQHPQLTVVVALQAEILALTRDRDWQQHDETPYLYDVCTALRQEVAASARYEQHAAARQHEEP